MKFNLQAATYDQRFRSTVAPWLMLRHWHRYQIRRSAIAYVPAYRRSFNRKTVGRVCAEMLLLIARWRTVPYHYLRYGLYDREHGLKDILGYLPETVLYYRLLSRLNQDVVLLDDKLVCKRILGDARVPQAALLLSGDANTCIDSAGRPVRTDSTDALSKLLDEGQHIVVKPARYSSGGDGVTVLTHKGGTLFDEHGDVVSLHDYGATWGPWLAEQFIDQHQELAALNERSLNTLRVITTCHPQRGSRVEYCVLKLGSSTGLVDNAHNGGLYLRVDMETGALGGVAFDETFTRHHEHPVTGVVFSGRALSMIRDVVALATRAATLFPTLSLIGWDIAVGEHGPVIIEGNSSPGLTNIQRTHGGVADSLGRYLNSMLTYPPRPEPANVH